MKFENIYKETEENMRLALLSLWTSGNNPMRPVIDKLLAEEPLLAEPVFQSTFSWEPTNDENWRSYLNKTVIDKLEIGKKYAPYKHQTESWKALKENKSIVVTSGTGSGKTECFMYPVISDLYEQEKSNAVQAIFLYPLNALMEDQKTRLAGYCKATGLKFAVYNGDSPEYRTDGQNDPYDNEVVTRTDIRDKEGKGTRPQIMLTNPSMLEYILIRQKDQVMLQKSAKKLRWLVIDEAHSYSGSAAVELAYQIKRILEAFDVTANEVRFACTSATIGGEEGVQSLAEFIATITGQDVSQIKVIGGKRLVPELDKKLLDKTIKEKNLPSADKLLSLRKKINEVPGMTLRQLWEWFKTKEQFNLITALQLVDKLCETEIGEKNHLLSLRAHYFMRAISGLYACANEDCKGTSGTLYGHFTTYKASVCPDCGKPLLELVQCKRCGGFELMGTSDSETHAVEQCAEGFNHPDYFSVGSDTDDVVDDMEEVEGTSEAFFLLPYDEQKYFNPTTKGKVIHLDFNHKGKHTTIEETDNGKWIELKKDKGASCCPNCGKLAKGKRLNFKYFRIPINFINQTISPVFLKECAKDDKYWGKYIAFTDSRQGTAISAKTFNIEVERRMCRSNVLEEFAKRRSLSSQPQDRFLNNPAFANFTKEQLELILANMPKVDGVHTAISLSKLSEIIYNSTLFHHMTGRDKAGDIPAYKASLMRQFIGRRQLYENGPETMGLLSLDYKNLSTVKIPNELQEYVDMNGLRISDKDWSDFLKLEIDYFVRLNNHIQPLIDGEKKYIRDSNLSSPFSAPNDKKKGIASWPLVKKDDNGIVSETQSRLVVLLCAGLGIDSLHKLQQNVRLINVLLTDAFNTLVEKGILTKVDGRLKTGYNNPDYFTDGRYADCYYINLSGEDTNDVCKVKPVEKVWACPVSGKLLDTTFCGYSPLITGVLSENLFKKYHCSSEQITMPQRPSNRDDVNEWLKSDETVRELQEKGFWSDRFKYVYNAYPEYIAAEHSAQQSKQLLRDYTKGFSQDNPSINVLQCSTTMEMGVDIGSIDVVLMDTVPPTAANYLQRVGRAGRMFQSKAIAFSLCNNTPVGQYAFKHPMWALQTTNHMIKVVSSQTIIQRHVNSYFFRRFVCANGDGIQANLSIDEFMTSICDAFIDFLDSMSTNKASETNFHTVFGNDVRYTIELTKECITDIKKRYEMVIKELEDALVQYEKEDKRKIAISNQIKKTKRASLLNYLSENQFIPNANMPIGVVTFDFMDKDQSLKINKLYNRTEKLEAEIPTVESSSQKTILEQELMNVRKEITAIRRATSASRDIHTALNEYAPEQTVVVNEKNYVSAGVMLFGAYNKKTQDRAIYHCIHCGNTEYSPSLNENKICSNCGQKYCGIIDKDNSRYTQAYEPIGFRTDSNIDSSREEKTDKQYYDIQPILLSADWKNCSKMDMCQVANGGDNGEILFYNVGVGYGFALCKRCGRMGIEQALHGSKLPYKLLEGHTKLWGGSCEASEQNSDYARHVVLTGMHHTCYAVFRFYEDISKKSFVNDQETIYSLGVIVKRALVEYLGIDETEIDFGVKQESDAWVLFVFDTAKGGCGYSTHLSDKSECQEIFEIARKKLENYDCECHINGGACAQCLIDRTNYRYANLLSKGKALDWLNRQKGKKIQLPQSVKAISPNANVVYVSLKDLVRQAISQKESTALTLCVSDLVGDFVVSEWNSIRKEIGKLIRDAVIKGKRVSLIVEYHPELHKTQGDKLPFIDLNAKFPDCDVTLVKDMGKVKTALIVESSNILKRYMVAHEEAIPFSDNWGNTAPAVFVDSQKTDFVSEELPVLTYSPSEVIRQGVTDVDHFRIENYFSRVLCSNILKQPDIDFLASILKGKNVYVTFSDMYMNSALSGLMLVYLLDEMRKLFGFKISTVTLQLDSRKRKCEAQDFNNYTPINFNFPSKHEADEYTESLFSDVLDVDVDMSFKEADHHRWLKIENEDGGYIEIRPDHGISGGWRSDSTYMNIESLDGKVEVRKKNYSEDILYYIIINKG